MAGGRPTKYHSKYSHEIIAFTVNGESLNEFAAHIGVSRDTLHKWRQDYEEFSDACAIADTQALAHYEKLGRMILYGKKLKDPKTGEATTIHYQSWAFQISRRWRQWQEKTAIEHTGKDGAPIESIDISKLSDNELEKLELLALAAKARPNKS